MDEGKGHSTVLFLIRVRLLSSARLGNKAVFSVLFSREEIKKPSRRRLSDPISQRAYVYRVNHQLVDMEWADFDLEVSQILTNSSADSAKIASAHSESGRERNSQNQSHPNPGPRGDGSLCSEIMLKDTFVSFKGNA